MFSFTNLVYESFKKLAFQIDPEKIHDLTLHGVSIFPFNFSPHSENYSVSLGQLKWNFPIGLAAGLDKNAMAIAFFQSLGFGAIEVGTVTPKPQLGNPRPRLFRDIENESLRNSMGFNNLGLDQVKKNIQSTRKKIPLGINIGKNKDTPNEDAINDYKILIRELMPLCDYMVINISSPNTKDLRSLQEGNVFREFLKELHQNFYPYNKPLFIKIAPDLSNESLEHILKITQEYNFSGLVATNTSSQIYPESGGASGKLLSQRAREVRNFLLNRIENKNFHLIGVGGVSDPSELWEFWKNGGRVMQIYTALIYQGPTIIYKFKAYIDEQLKKHKCQKVEELLTLLHKN